MGMRVPRGVDSAPPRLWWDAECDVSLLVGTYKHGYENYLAMRSDPQLCFVDKLGPPDDAECTDIKYVTYLITLIIIHRCFLHISLIYDQQFIKVWLSWF